MQFRHTQEDKRIDRGGHRTIDGFKHFKSFPSQGSNPSQYRHKEVLQLEKEWVVEITHCLYCTIDLFAPFDSHHNRNGLSKVVQKEYWPNRNNESSVLQVQSTKFYIGQWWDVCPPEYKAGEKIWITFSLCFIHWIASKIFTAHKIWRTAMH